MFAQPEKHTMDITIIQQKIYKLRNQKVMPCFDPANLYGAVTKALNQSVKHNFGRFRSDFMFQPAFNAATCS